MVAMVGVGRLGVGVGLWSRASSLRMSHWMKASVVRRRVFRMLMGELAAGGPWLMGWDCVSWLMLLDEWRGWGDRRGLTTSKLGRHSYCGMRVFRDLLYVCRDEAVIANMEPTL